MGIISDKLANNSSGIISSRVKTNNYQVTPTNIQRKSPIIAPIEKPVEQPKRNLGTDLLDIYKNLGSGITQIPGLIGSALSNVFKENIVKRDLPVGNLYGKLAEKYNLEKPKEIANPIKQTAENLLNRVSNVSQNLVKTETQKQQTRTEQIKNPILKKASEITPVIGQMVPTIGASIINPVLGAAVSTAGATGSYIGQAKEKGATDRQAVDYGMLLGTAEGLTEMIGIGALLKGTKAVAKGGLKQGIKSLGVNALNNAIQEGAMEPIQEATSQVILGKSDWKNVPQRMLQSGIDGATIGLIMSGAGAGIGKSVNIANKISQGELVTTQEINQAKQEIQTKKPELVKTVENIQSKTTTQQKTTQPIIQEPTKAIQPVLNNEVSNLPDNQVGRSNFADSLQNSKFITKEAKQIFSKQEDINKYKKINNNETMQKANEKILEDPNKAVVNFLGKDVKKATAEDVTTGIQLMTTYQNAGDYNSMVEVAKKLREIGTESGQTVQAFSIMQRMTPEGMVKYAQSELSDVADTLLKTKTKEWINKNVGDLTLNETEVQNIVDKMKTVQTTTDIREKAILLAEISKIVSDKIPANIGDSVKAYRRISMLLNPKTITRNILGNTLVAPINMASESTVGTLTDKALSKLTGVRTTGVTNLKTYGKEFLKGGAEAFDDFRRGINTRDINVDKFEAGRGKNFSNKTIIGKALNKLDTLTNFTLDIGDRPFFKAEFMNSLNNQMKLNNVTEPTADMIDIATKIAEQRTWQDSNAYTKSVLEIRKGLNKINIKGVGLGDVVIPFAKTPANLTKAIFDYSPAGVINAIVDGNKLRIALNNGTFTPQMQKKLVDDVSKAFAGTILYILGSALAKSGITSGEADKDKDLAKFKKDVMGIQPYSIKIGDKTFTYDWANPIATPLGVMANAEQSKNEKGQESSRIQDIINAFSQGGSMLYDQSFLQNVKNIFTANDPIQGALQTISTIPASFVPTFVKQLNDFIDPTTRNTYEYNDLAKTSLQQTIAKIPGLSQLLPAQKDVLGRDIKKYSGENNPFNIFFNPSNVAKENSTVGSKELLKVYEATGDKTIIPKLAPNYFEYKNTKYNLGGLDKTDWQKNIGQNTSKEIDSLADNNFYKSLTNEQKAKAIKTILNDTTEEQKQSYLKKQGVDFPFSKSTEEAKSEIAKGLPTSTYYSYKAGISNIEGNKDTSGKTIEGSTQGKKALAIMNLNIPEKDKNSLLNLMTTSKIPATINELKILPKTEKSFTDYFKLTETKRKDYQDITDLGINQDKFNKFVDNLSKIKGVYKNGKVVTGSREANVQKYLNTLGLTNIQKAILTNKAGFGTKEYNNQIYNYVMSKDITNQRKSEILKSLGIIK